MASTKQHCGHPVSWAEHMNNRWLGGDSAKKEAAENDPHYYKNRHRRQCLCGDERCAEYWKRWIDLNDDKRAGYLMLPVNPIERNTPLQKAMYGFLGVVYRHLHGNGVRVPDRTRSANHSPLFVAYHHFHPAILQENQTGPVPVVDSRTADMLGFMDSDKLLRHDVTESGYYAAPSFPLPLVLEDLLKEERIHGIPQVVVEPTVEGKSDLSTKGSVASASRTSPEEREMDRLMRQVQD